MFKAILLCVFLACAGPVWAAGDDAKTTTGTPDLPPTSSTPLPPTPLPPNVNPVNPHTGIVNFTLSDTTKSIVCALGSFGGSVNFDIANTTTVQNTTVANSFSLDQTVVLDVGRSLCTANHTTLFFDVHSASDSNVTLAFFLSHDGGNYKLDAIQVNYTYVNSTKKEASVEVFDLELAKDENKFTAPDDKSYECLSKETLKLTNSTKAAYQQTGTITFENFKLDAFRHDNSTTARADIKCWLDSKTRDFVPLAVAIALIILIVIVLVAYLIGRKRSRRLAYESV